MIEPTASTANRKSIGAWLIRFYNDNPGEELTFQDIVTKYGCTLWSARQAVYALQRGGVLESVHIIRARNKVSEG